MGNTAGSSRGCKDWRASQALVGVFCSLVVPLLLRGLEKAPRELFSLHCAGLNPLQTTSLCHQLSSLPYQRKLKAAQGYVTDYIRERKGKGMEEKSKQEIQQILLGQQKCLCDQQQLRPARATV